MPRSAPRSAANFPTSWRQPVASAREEGSARRSQRLVDAGLVFQRGAPPAAEYLFKHALVQDAAYGTLLRGPRQQLHARIAGALEAHFPELMESQPELFAQHYAEAGLVEKSVACWGKAGHRSAARSAMAEAAAQLQKGLDQLELLPDELERQRQELEIRSALGAVFQALKGLAHRKQAKPMLGHESFGSSWGFPLTSFKSLMASLVIMWPEVNSIWRCAYQRIYCV